jgi:hypothetical protein
MLRRSVSLFQILRPLSTGTISVKPLPVPTGGTEAPAPVNPPPLVKIPTIPSTPLPASSGMTLLSIVKGASELAFAAMKSFSGPAKEQPMTLSDATVQQVKALYLQVYQLIENGDVKGANALAKNELLKLVDIYKAIEIGNFLLREDKAFREYIQKVIVHCVESTTPHVAYEHVSPEGKPVPGFRSVRVRGNYGDPKFVMEQGFTSSLLNTRPDENGDIVVPASIVSFVAEKTEAGDYDAKLALPGRYDKLGFTFGPMISIAFNVFHALFERYMEPDFRKNEGDRVVYLVATTEAFNTAHAIHEGTGYIRDKEKGQKGEKGTSNQEDAAEAAAAAIIENDKVLGYRIIKANGDILPFVANPKASRELLDEFKQYSDVKLFMDVKTLKEAQEREAIIIDDAKKVEDHTTKLLRFMKKNKVLTQEIEAQARGRLPKDELLHSQVHGHGLVPPGTICADTIEHAELFAEAKTHRTHLKHGSLIDGQRRFFHQLKARSEEELKERSIIARKQSAQKKK